MRRSIGLSVFLCLTVAMVGVASCERPVSPAVAPKIRRIAIIARSPATDYWEAIHTGAAAAARDARDVLLTYRGPGVDGDAALQEAIVQEMLSAKPDALVLAPADDSLLGAPLEKARQANIPIVVIDRDLVPQAGYGITAVVTADNQRCGALAAERIGETLKGGKVVLFRHSKGDPDATLREEAFGAAIAGKPALTFIDSRRYAGATVAGARKEADALLGEHAEIGAVFCPSEVGAHGMVLALRERFLNGKVKVIGFQSSLFLVQAMAMGDVDALIVPDPVTLGKLGVRAALDSLEGKPVQARQVIGVELATRSNMHDDPMKFLLLPDLLPVPPGQ